MITLKRMQRIHRDIYVFVGVCYRVEKVVLEIL